MTEEKIKIFKKLFGNDQNVRFVNCGKSELTAQPWKIGRAVYPYAGHDGLSTGYRGYYIDSNGTRYEGFVSAGHTFDVGDYAYYSSAGSSSYMLGQCKKARFFGNVDAAFIAITSSFFEPSNVLHYADNKGTTSGTLSLNCASYETDFAVGSMIFKVGCASYLTAGAVLDDSGEVYYKNFDRTITNVIVADVECKPGDSGGCVFVASGDEFIVAGSISGRNVTYYETWEEFHWSYTSQAKYACSGLGITLY